MVFVTKKERWRYSLQCFYHSFVVIIGSLILFFLNKPQFGDNCIILFLTSRMCKNITIYKYVTLEIFKVCLGIRYLHSYNVHMYIEWHILVCYIIGREVTRVSGQTSSKSQQHIPTIQIWKFHPNKVKTWIINSNS